MNAQECGTETPQNYQTYEGNPLASPSSTLQNYCINVAFRIVRNNDGSNAAFNVNNLSQVLNIVNSNYSSHQISFVQISYDYINNSNLNNDINALSQTNIPNAINIYIVNNISGTTAGIASVSTNSIRIEGTSMFDTSLTHELGHCLNLKHTFQCTWPTVTLGCAENPDGSNCANTGDQICDTPADPYLAGQTVTINGTSITYPSPPYPIANYNPDKTNYMSYWHTKGYILTHFSLGQGQRMRDAIQNATWLQNVRSNQCSIIEGPNNICSTGNYIFSITGYGNPLTYSWNVSSNLQVVGSSTGSSLIVKSSDPNNAGTATITVIINGSATKTKTINIGPPVNNNRVIGYYDWVSTNYGNMGLVAPTNSSITSFRWEIEEDPDFPNTCSQSTKPRFIGAPIGDPYHYTSTSNQAVVNWGSCTKSYLITCYAINDCGETFYDQRYTDVGNPKNNPCYKNTIHTVIAPNPIRDRQVNVVVNRTIQSTPCNYKNPSDPQFFNRELDVINNSISIYDYNGNEVFRKVYETDEFTIENIDLQSRNNYIVNLFTKEGGFTQQIIVVE